MVMDQGNFHLMDNNLKFTIIWELTYLSKSTEPQLNRTVDFISDRSFLSHTNPESWQNSRSIAVSHVSVAYLQAESSLVSSVKKFFRAPCI